MEAKLQQLKKQLNEIMNVDAAGYVLRWDQSTYMPPGGGPARGRHLATLQRISQEKFTDPQIGQWLEDLRGYEESLPYDSDDASLIRITRREYERRARIPPEFTERRARHRAASYQAWIQARPANDFEAVRPYLEKSLELSREYAAFFPEAEHIADPFIATSEPGMTVADVRRIFDELRANLVPLVKAVTERPAPDDSFLHQHFPGTQQIAFARDVVAQFGFDFERGRIDLTHHPFAIQFSVNDVRITTRADDYHLGDGVFATFHEAGHGLYEQGANPAYDGTPLAGLIGWKSAAVHESQSRLWENLVGRSHGFWHYYFPRLQAVFPEQLQNVSLEAFYRAINKVTPSLIRVQADELTYNLHIMIRFDLELDLLEGRLAVRDLPAAWRERYQSDLGITPPDHKDGVLQDVHWFAHGIGGSFQGYTLGNVLSAQFFEAACRAHPEIPAEIRQGQFQTLHTWLKENIYWHGAKFTAQELARRVTGEELQVEPYLRYLRNKYGELYGLPG